MGIRLASRNDGTATGIRLASRNDGTAMGIRLASRNDDQKGNLFIKKPKP